jgi:hypothetical protein
MGSLPPPLQAGVRQPLYSTALQRYPRTVGGDRKRLVLDDTAITPRRLVLSTLRTEDADEMVEVLVTIGATSSSAVSPANREELRDCACRKFRPWL